MIRRYPASCIAASMPLAATAVLFIAAAPVAGDRTPVASLPAHMQQSGTPTTGEIAAAHRWLEAILHGYTRQSAVEPWSDGWIGAGLPFSFRLDGRPCDLGGSGWKLAEVQRRPPAPGAEASAERIDVEWQGPGGLKLRWQIQRFVDFPAVDWLLSLENAGGKDSPLIEDFQALRLKLNQSQPVKDYVVHGANGGRCLPDDLMAFSLPVPRPDEHAGPAMQILRQDFENLEIGRSILQTPLVIGTKHFAHGVGTHSVSRIRIRSPQPIERFSAWIGVDHNERTKGGAGSIVFSLAGPERELYRSGVFRGGQEPAHIDVDAKGAQVLLLNVDDAGDGPSCDHADWAEATITLRGGKVVRLDDLPRGRPDAVVLGSQMLSSNNHLPLFNLDTSEGRGVLVGLGWTGAWKAEMVRKSGELTAQAGLPVTRFRLRPGEQVRMPRVLLTFWNGQRMHGHNMLRRLLYEHYVAHLPGKPHEPQVSVNLCFTHHGKGGFLEQATEQSVMSLLEPCRQLGVEAFVIDAGWYPCKQWGDIMATADFTCDLKKYPHGFRPLAEVFRKAGIAFGLWFPPEALGSYAKPEIPRRFADIVSGFVQRDGINMYRQDGGLLPTSSEPDRQGVVEMQHIAGLYAMQDQLRSRFPSLVMEGCCGGGRRIDLESVSRFLWHQKSDKWFDTPSDHCGLHGANMFLPGGVINVPTEAIDDYGVWSSFGGQLCLAWHPLDRDFPMEKAKQQVALYKEIRRYLCGDFYPLTECSLDAPWLAYQFHRSDLDEGFLLVFRRKPGGSNTLKLAPCGLDPSKRYTMTFRPSGKELIATGEELARGNEIALPAAPAAMLVKYRSAKR
jgi:alpha-galactosidase